MCPLRVQRPVRPLPPAPLQSLSDRGCPRTWPILQRNRYSAAFAFSSFFPSVIPLFLFPSHRPGRNRETLAIGKLDHHAEETPPRCGLPQDVIDRVFSGRLCTLNQCPAKTNFLDFFGLNAVTGNVSDSIWRPDELANLHSLILHRTCQDSSGAVWDTLRLTRLAITCGPRSGPSGSSRS